MPADTSYALLCSLAEFLDDTYRLNPSPGRMVQNPANDAAYGLFVKRILPATAVFELPANGLARNKAVIDANDGNPSQRAVWPFPNVVLLWEGCPEDIRWTPNAPVGPPIINSVLFAALNEGDENSMACVYVMQGFEGKSLGMIWTAEFVGDDHWESSKYCHIFRRDHKTADKWKDAGLSSLRDQESREYDMQAREIAVRDLMWDLHYISLPRHHLVEETPRSATKAKERSARSGKIPRLHDRSRVRLIEPEAVRRTYPTLNLGTGTSKTPHKRRGHIRTLHSDRFGERKGTTVYVRPAWIGPGEWSDSKTHYRVIQPKKSE